jgi:hypothetical protein
MRLGHTVFGFRLGEIDRCFQQFRKHCIHRHGLASNDTERVCWFDLEALTFTLVSQ